MKNSSRVALLCWYAAATLANQQQSLVKLTKAFYHQGALSDKVSLYFDKDPHCTQLPERPTKKSVDGHATLTLFLPHVLIDSHEARQTIHKINKEKGTPYHLSLHEVKTPAPGVKITLSYDPEQIVCDYTTTDVISAQKSLIISLHNKKTLEKIRQASTPILRYASAAQPICPRVMIDCGHGGSDNGTVGYHLIKEKDVTLKVGKKLIAVLKKKGFDVCVTRDHDTFVSLDERTALANKKEVDLFISIHANSAPSAAAQGIETHWAPRMSLLDKKKEVLKEYVRFDGCNESFAQVLHTTLVDAVQKKYKVSNRAVKKSVAQVLIGTDMPSALIEIGFLSNAAEAKLLNNEIYQMAVAQGICAGIEQFYRQIL